MQYIVNYQVSEHPVHGLYICLRILSFLDLSDCCDHLTVVWVSYLYCRLSHSDSKDMEYNASI